MSNSRHYKRLSLILAPSPPLSVVSHGQPRTAPRDSDSVPISHQEGSRSLLVKSPKRSLQAPPPVPKMHPLLSGSVTSDLPLIVFSQTCSGSGPLVSQLPRGKPRSPRSQPRATSDREKQTTELPKSKLRSPDLFSPTPVELQKPPRTLRNRRAMKHRASVDVTSAAGWIMSADGGGPKQVTVSSSNRSLWTHKRGQASAGGCVWDREDRLGPVEPLPEPLPEKQRAMNVRRAKKMQQVFGSELPSSLVQITQAAPVPEEENDVVDGFDDRASVSTLFSTTTVNFQPSKPRALSTSSTVVGSTPPLTPTSPVLPSSEELEPALPRFEQSFTRQSLEASPPFSHSSHPDAHNTVTRSEPSKPSARTERNVRRKEKEFRQRRMRAAKLSKFFGVGYQDLEPHLASGGDEKEVRKLEVAIDDRGPLPWDRHEFRNLEMEDAIVRLRDLRSS